MKNDNRNYYELPNKSLISKQVLNYALNSQDWVDYYNFKAIQIPNTFIHLDPTLQKLSFKYSFAMGVIMLPPNTCYDWHIDTRRGVGVNMLLTPEVRSSCLFAMGDGVQFGFEELKYEPDTYYLFNTQTKHMVLNFERPRYLFTVEFELDKNNLNFENLLAQIQK